MGIITGLFQSDTMQELISSVPLLVSFQNLFRHNNLIAAKETAHVKFIETKVYTHVNSIEAKDYTHVNFIEAKGYTHVNLINV